MATSTPEPGPDERLFTVDELASASGLTVRTTRYYASLGLLPPPAKRGRMAWYDDTHLARLEMIRALQEHGFTLQAIEGYLASLPADAALEDLALQRAMLTAWAPPGPQEISRRQLEKHAGRRLGEEQLRMLEDVGIVRRTEDERGARFTPLQGFDVAVELLDLDIPMDGMRAAGAAISHHIDALATDLTRILRDEVVEPHRQRAHTHQETERFERTLTVLRRLTLEAIVSAFQRSANDLIARSLQREQGEASHREAR
ncbi:MerR family transcriptional regulator [Nocardioides panacisoli]|uniref:MerR family transcriptional regulator n=1 Tax=Nocardioides panacisoli TaxID=627624 RepID=UPI001C6319F8|nr:MerR family transcriptional regulator [Nocardioides panacisoli]QYJ04422.1 MerR family transcriptional regulator [Nocardioides panacisoli]